MGEKPGGRGPTRTLSLGIGAAAAGIMVALALGISSSASAAPLTYLGCVANGGKHGCADARSSLSGAQSVVTSPNGRDVYLASFFAGSITVFERDGRGGLKRVQCLAEYNERGCSRMPHGYLLDEVSGLAMSPDGRTVYAVSGEGIVVFARAGDGSLIFKSCVEARSDGCQAPKHFPPGGDSAAVSPDGHSLYVVSDGLVQVFSRAPSGRLRAVDCYGERDTFPHCKPLSFEASIGATTVAVSPNNRAVYVGGFEAITSFHRRPDGTLDLRSCIANRAKEGCVGAPHRLGILWAGLAAPGRGDWVYAASLGDKLSVLAAHRDGSLTYHGCVTDHTSNACAQIPDETLLGTGGMAANPTGEALYVGGFTTVTRLLPQGDGTLRFAGCVADRGRDRPRICSSTGNDSLQDVRSVAASADGSSVFAASRDANAVAVLGG